MRLLPFLLATSVIAQDAIYPTITPAPSFDSRQQQAFSTAGRANSRSGRPPHWQSQLSQAMNRAGTTIVSAISKADSLAAFTKPASSNATGTATAISNVPSVTKRQGENWQQQASFWISYAGAMATYGQGEAAGGLSVASQALASAESIVATADGTAREPADSAIYSAASVISAASSAESRGTGVITTMTSTIKGPLRTSIKVVTSTSTSSRASPGVATNNAAMGAYEPSSWLVGVGVLAFAELYGIIDV